MIKQKGLKITIFVLLIILAISVFCGILIIVVDLNIDRRYSPHAAYDFGSGSITDAESSNYTANSTFEISSLSEFNNFSESVAAGLTFAGKTVKLTAEVSGGHGSEIKPVGIKINNNGNVSSCKAFSGTFDGQGHTISNVYFNQSGSAVGHTVNWLGIFCNLESATVKNLRVFAFRIVNYSAPLAGFQIGGIAGNASANSTIENCMVEDFAVTNNDEYGTEDGCWVGGILGRSYTYSGTVKILNCMVKDFEVRGEATVETVNIGPAYLPASHSINLSNCVIQDGCSTNYKSGTGVTAENIHSTANTTTGLSKSSTGGASGSTWYYSSKYNNGFPYLRIFMSWTTYYFKVENSNHGRVSSSSVEVPSDCAGASESSNKVNFDCGETVTAIASAAYSFSSWTKSGYTYTAHFSDKICEISFSLYDWECVAETNNLELNTDYYIPYGGNLKITYDKCGAGTFEYTYWDDYEYKEITKTMYSLNSITYEFYGKDEAGNWATRKITYRPLESKYCIGINTEGITTSLLYTYYEGDNKFEPYSYDWFGSPSVFLKKYNIEFN